MTDEPEFEEEQRPERVKLRQIGFGTVSIMVVFITIISLMCVGSVFILVMLAFRSS